MRAVKEGELFCGDISRSSKVKGNIQTEYNRIESVLKSRKYCEGCKSKSSLEVICYGAGIFISPLAELRKIDRKT